VSILRLGWTPSSEEDRPEHIIKKVIQRRRVLSAYHVIGNEVTGEDVDKIDNVEILHLVSLAVLDAHDPTELGGQSLHCTLPFLQITEEGCLDLHYNKHDDSV
jgi:hypothetical protein